MRPLCLLHLHRAFLVDHLWYLVNANGLCVFGSWVPTFRDLGIKQRHGNYNFISATTSDLVFDRGLLVLFDVTVHVSFTGIKSEHMDSSKIQFTHSRMWTPNIRTIILQMTFALATLPAAWLLISYCSSCLSETMLTRTTL